MIETQVTDSRQWIEKVRGLGDDRARRSFFKRHGEAVDSEFVDALCSEVNRLAWVDGEQALRLAATASWLAEALDDDRRRARCARAAGNVLHVSGECERAQELYLSALELLDRLGDEREAAITRSSALFNLGYLGEYEMVRKWEESAREIFERLDDRQRLAMLENNFANTLYRQDLCEEALPRYRMAYEEFVKLGNSQDAAISLRNVAACHINLHNFTEALAAYDKARACCRENGLDRLLHQVDYNVAYLYYQQGEYTRAAKLYRETRRQADERGDDHHKALCDLDQAEMFLELNMVEEAAQLARSAIGGFEKLNFPYELAKALTNSAIALSRQGKGVLALGQLQKARQLFVQENNRLWSALIDFYQAVVLYREHRPAEAIRLVQGVREIFWHYALAAKAVMCELLLAELLLDLERPEQARRTCYDTLTRLEGLDLPVLEHRAYMILGKIEEVLGDRLTALDAYRESLRWLERLRGQLQDEDLKISFLADKGVVYESLVWLTMQDETISGRKEKTFDYIEQARSRSLADLMAFRAYTLPSKAPAQSELAEHLRTLREELNYFYREIDRQQMTGEERALEGVKRLRQSTHEKEDELLRTLRELQADDEELSSLQSGGMIDLETVRSSLPADAVLVEYFIARGTVFGCVADRDRLEILPLTTAQHTQEIHRRLQFQLSRSALTGERSQAPSSLVEEAILSHLTDLDAELLSPIRHHLDKDHLVIVPHGFLHYVPFHALFDGERHLIDRHSISYAPSASVFHFCATKQSRCRDTSLVLGVADERAPLIAEEVQAVAEALPEVTLLLDEDANQEALQRHGAASRFIHIASHGLFRRDNPMFSAIQLGSSRLSLFDLYNLRLTAELVVLSGCGTGLNAVVGSDELVGLTRGLLYAGAHSLLVSLWDVNDASTSFLMRRFYHHLARGDHRAQALRQTMRDVRERYPNPYHWAPFVLVGKPSS